MVTCQGRALFARSQAVRVTGSARKRVTIRAGHTTTVGFADTFYKAAAVSVTG
jgi:hypothetical protein